MMASTRNLIGRAAPGPSLRANVIKFLDHRLTLALTLAPTLLNYKGGPYNAIKLGTHLNTKSRGSSTRHNYDTISKLRMRMARGRDIETHVIERELAS
jgi:hypothetical protein